MSSDTQTAAAFATSWNNLPPGSVYTREQFEDWLAPLAREDVAGKDVVELGCGNGSLLTHMAEWEPARLVGVDLGDSVQSARENLQRSGHTTTTVLQADLVDFRSEGFDVAYCIGVLHHLKRPQDGFNSVVANTRPGGRFHCWVYAREGNGLVRLIVEPVRTVASRLPWWVTKYLIATPLVAPYFLYAKAIRALSGIGEPMRKILAVLPLYEYSLWIAQRGFAFFRHVAFDQLVTPQTIYVSRDMVARWLDANPRIDPDSTYIILRNGNSWKFGGRTRIEG